MNKREGQRRAIHYRPDGQSLAFLGNLARDRHQARILGIPICKRSGFIVKYPDEGE